MIDKMRKKVSAKYGFSFNSIEVEVEETPGQSAVYLHKDSL